MTKGEILAVNGQVKGIECPLSQRRASSTTVHVPEWLTQENKHTNDRHCQELGWTWSSFNTAVIAVTLQESAGSWEADLFSCVSLVIH